MMNASDLAIAIESVASKDNDSVAGVSLFQLCSNLEDPTEFAESIDCRSDDSLPHADLPAPQSLVYSDLDLAFNRMHWSNLSIARDYFGYVYLHFGHEISTDGGGEKEGRLRMVCAKASTAKSRTDPANVTSNSSSDRCGCGWKVNLSVLKDGTVRVAKSNAHNWTHSCIPNPVLREGGILSVRQLSGPMIEWLKSAGKQTPSALSTNLAKKFSLSYVSQHVISTAYTRFRGKSGNTQTDQLLDYLMKHPESLVHSVDWNTESSGKSSRRTIKNLFIMTHTMRAIFKQYGHFLVVDATYKTNDFARPLVIFSVRTGTGHYAIVGIALIADEQSCNLKWAFEQLKQFVDEESWQSIQTVMTDGEVAYNKLLSDIVPKAVHQRCYFHQHRNMMSRCKELTDALKASKLMESAMLCDDEKIAEAKWQELLDNHLSSTNLGARPQGPKKRKSSGSVPAWVEQLGDDDFNLWKSLKSGTI